MAITLVRKYTRINSNRCHYIMDTVDDAKNLPKSCTGSTAVAALGGKVFMVNASGEWVETGTATYNLAEGVSF